MLTQSNVSQQSPETIAWTILFFSFLLGMAVDFIEPSIPQISAALLITKQSAKNIIAFYLFGEALGNLFTGFVTDAFGRKNLLRFYLLFFVSVSCLPLFMPTTFIILLTRFLQGICYGASAVVARAILADVLPPKKLLYFGTLMGTAWGISALLMPVFGGYLQVYFGWRAIFITYAIFTFIFFAVAFFYIPETHFTRESIKLKKVVAHFNMLLANRAYMGYTMLIGFSYAPLVVYGALGSFLIEDCWRFSPIDFGHLTLIFGVLFLLATFVARCLIRFYEAEALLQFMLFLACTLTFLFILLCLFFSNSKLPLLFASGIIYFTCGFVYPLCLGKGLSFFKHMAGTATAFMFFINITIPSLVGFFISFVKFHNAMPILFLYASLLFLALGIYQFLIHANTSKVLAS